MSATVGHDKKSHVCPPSDAVHPSGRWETMFVYAFICKFTNLRGKVDGLETPMDFEDALMSHGHNDILARILAQFVVNLKPQTRNVSDDQISTTVAAILADYFKSSERTIFWNDELKKNVDPFIGLNAGFFSADWDLKLKALRQLVDLQLCHSADIKGTIDRAWGVSQHKHKKKDVCTAPLDPLDPKSQECLLLQPLGQNSRRTRYWVVDDSPRVFASTNPWKITATFQAVTSTKEEYLKLIDELKASAPGEFKKGEKRTKPEQAHLALIAALEGRIETIDMEIARAARAKKKLEQRRVLLAQAEIRETRTRRQARKPDYVYADHYDSEDDGDEYTYQADDVQDEEFDDEVEPRDSSARSKRGRGHSTSGGLRRSSRTTARINANGKRESSSDSWSYWRGERRSARLGGVGAESDFDPPLKRARTEDSTVSSTSAEHPSDAVGNGTANGLKIKSSGAAALKPTEIALEQIAGKKKSKFWVYAVEPVLQAPANIGTDAMEEDPAHDSTLTKANGIENHVRTNGNDTLSTPTSLRYDHHLKGSLSP